MKPSDILRAAAVRLETYGWCQYTDELPDGRCCMRGAVWNVHTSAREALEALRKLEANLQAMTAGTCGIGAWNDAPGRTIDEVIAKLHEVADRLESEGT